jgi:hypothetical protein
MDTIWLLIKQKQNLFDPLSTGGATLCSSGNASREQQIGS